MTNYSTEYKENQSDKLRHKKINNKSMTLGNTKN